MRRAISNIAWPDAVKLSDIASILHRFGIDGIECAPAKMHHDCGLDSDAQAKDMRNIYEDLGFCVPAFQAILFGHPELQVFDRSTHHGFFEHLKRIASMAADVGAKTLVFGAPKNKHHDSTLLDDSLGIACDFFHRAGDVVGVFGCVLGLEANPREYQCNFLTTTDEARRFVKMVDSQYVSLHLDTGTMLINDEDWKHEIECGSFCHFHISAPYLGSIADVECKPIVDFLDEVDYRGYASIEMKSSPREVDSSIYIEHALDSIFETRTI